MRKMICLALSLALLPACGGGGGGGPSETPTSWSQFRRDGTRRGVGGGIVQDNPGALRAVAVDARNPDLTGNGLAPIIASPVIDLEGNVYIASEAGTVLSVVPSEELRTKWVVSSCPICCPGAADPNQPCDDSIGPIVSTPALFQGDDTTSLVVADRLGRVYFLDVDDKVKDAVPECTACFDASRDARLRDEFGPEAQVDFVSSPTFTINILTLTIAKVLIGARISTPNGTVGKLYAINNDGSLRWQYPRRGEPTIAAVTSSPNTTASVGDTVYLLTDDGVLHTLTGDGVLKREVAAAELEAADDLFVPSAVSVTSGVFTAGTDGVIRAFNHSGSQRWQAEFPGERFLGTLVASSQSLPPESPTVEGSATPTMTGPTPTPTPTFTPALDISNLFAVSEAGRLVIVDDVDGGEVTPSSVVPDAPVEGSVFASPVVSTDRLLIFTASDGRIYMYDTSTLARPRLCVGGSEDGRSCTFEEGRRQCVTGDGSTAGGGICAPSPWPLQLPGTCTGDREQLCREDSDCVSAGSCDAPGLIHSSPAIDDDGVIFVGSDDGFLYVIGPTGTPAPNPRTPQATAVATETPSATETPAITATAGSTGTQVDTPDATQTPVPSETPAVTP